MNLEDNSDDYSYQKVFSNTSSGTNMDRRSLLLSLASGTAALAGCATDSDGDATTDPPAGTAETRAPPTTRSTIRAPSGDDEPGDTQKQPERPEDPMRIVELETTPRTVALSSTWMQTDDEAEVVLWFDRTATDDHPVRVRGWLQNANRYPNTFDIESISTVGHVHSRQPDGYDHEASLHLAPTENNALAESVPQVRQNDDGVWIASDIGPWMTETRRLEPGEYVELEYVLVGEPGTPGRPTGTYTFTGGDRPIQMTVWDSNSPGPDMGSRFAGRSVPDFDADLTVSWYHDADRTTPAFVRPSTERLELDGRAEFEIVNNSHQQLQCGHWNLYKLVDSEWFHVGPVVHTLDCRILHPGDRKTWSLRAFNGEAVPCEESHRGLTRGYLGGGEYAGVVGYSHQANKSGALVEVVGDAVTVTPTDDVETERDGQTITVTADRYGDDDRPADATLTLTRAESADERLIAEQVMRTSGIRPENRSLRNALAVLEPDVETVVVRTDERAVDNVVGYDSTTRRFRFQGQAYEVTKRTVDD